MHYEILLVDDEKSVTKAINRVLRNEFSAVHEAHSAAEALVILKENHIDVVISDYKMPDVNGSELLSKVHKLYPDIINVMLSGQADMDGFSKALNDGAISKFLCKPWDNVKLKVFILETIEEHKSLQLRDALTRLPTLRMFTQQIKHLRSNELSGACVALVNIADFSEINIRHGIKVSNRLLVEIANRLNLMFPHHILTRVKDDIFAIVLEDEANIGKETKDLLRVISMPILMDDFEVSVSGTIGITPTEDWKYNQAENIQRNLEQMKVLTSDTQQVVFCTPERHDAWFRNATLISELQNAIKLNQLTLIYQPQIDYGDQQVIGCEALLRWFHPRRGLLLADEFIPLIERYKMADNLLEMILDQVLQFMSTKKQLFEDIKMSINLFASQLGNPKLTELILHKLQHYDISPYSIELEITETSLISSFDDTRAQLNTLRDAGITIAIDDFGTGYASYEYLCELPVDVVKIDGCFIKGMYNSLEKSTALSTIISTANILSLEIVAEYVEEERQAKLLTEMGCKRLQGYWFSKPLNQNDFVNFTSIYNSVSN